MFLGTEYGALAQGQDGQPTGREVWSPAPDGHLDPSAITVNAQGNPYGLAGVGSALTVNAPGVGPFYDPGYKRVYRDDETGQLCVTVNTGRWTTERGERVPITEGVFVRDMVNAGLMSPPTPTTNATALRKEEWIEYDRRVIRAARRRLRAYSDVNTKSGSFGGFNAMGKMILEHEVMADPGEAIVDMTGLTHGRNDMTSFQLRGLPLPITHCDFWVDARKLAISRNSGTPFDSNMGEACARRVGEMVEKTTIGNVTGVTYGGASTYVGGYDLTSKVFGITNYTNRLTGTGYKPTGLGRAGTGWQPIDTLKDVQATLKTLRNNKFYGPFMIYHSDDWDDYLDQDYFVGSGQGTTSGLSTWTLRQRLTKIGEGDGNDAGENVVLGVRRLDFLFGTAPTSGKGNQGADYYDNLYAFTLLIVQMTPEVIRAVNGLDVTTVQWEEKGGLLLKFKVMCIQVPQLFSDFYGNCGIYHLTCST